MRKRIILSLFILTFCALSFSFAQNVKRNSTMSIGQPIDSLNGVIVYYNGPMENVIERNMTTDNYNLGLKYQCVEFAKRYYYEHYKHKMPETYGNAKDFFDKSLADGARNVPRDLKQYTNPSQKKPQVGDLLIYDATVENPYGHLAIVSQIFEREIEIIQQNPGPALSSRERFALTHLNNKWKIGDARIIGWLRKE